MPFIKLSALLSTLSVNTSSAHPTTNDSARVETTLFEDSTPTPSDIQAVSPTPRVTNVLVKHSSAFNSERTTGMNKVQQLQFVEMLRSAIIDQALSAYKGYQVFKVSMARSRKSSPAAPKLFCSATMHTAILLGMEASGRGWTVLEKSDECEYLGDAMEDMWGRVMEAVGEAVGEFKIGEMMRTGEEGAAGGVEKAESSDTLLSA